MDLVFPKTEMLSLFRAKYGEPTQLGPKPQRRLKFNYFLPDDYYEALVNRFVTPGCRWLDVGGGRNLFPFNVPLAEELAKRAGHLTGVDPSPNIHENQFVCERVQARIEEYQSNEPFDLLTLRMVAEHIAKPNEAMAAFARLLKPSGKLIIYTINKWTPISIISMLTPFKIHHSVKKTFWQTEEKDTFPVAYKMNSRHALTKLAQGHGFREFSFRRLDDLSTFSNFRLLNYAELFSWKLYYNLGFRYPENCLLGVYERLPEPATA